MLVTTKFSFPLNPGFRCCVAIVKPSLLRDVLPLIEPQMLLGILNISSNTTKIVSPGLIVYPVVIFISSYMVFNSSASINDIGFLLFLNFRIYLSAVTSYDEE